MRLCLAGHAACAIGRRGSVRLIFSLCLLDGHAQGPLVPSMYNISMIQTPVLRRTELCHFYLAVPLLSSTRMRSQFVSSETTFTSRGRSHESSRVRRGRPPSSRHVRTTPGSHHPYAQRDSGPRVRRRPYHRLAVRPWRIEEIYDLEHSKFGGYRER